MQTVLADTSIWVSFLRRSSGQNAISFELDRLLVNKQLCVCGPIYIELMAGSRNEQSRDALTMTLRMLPWVDLNRASWELAGRVAAGLRESGFAASFADIQIAISACQVGAKLWSDDKDFQRIRKVLPDLQLYQPGS